MLILFLDRIKWEIKPPSPKVNYEFVALQGDARHFSIIEIAANGGHDFSLQITKIVVYFMGFLWYNTFSVKSSVQWFRIWGPPFAANLPALVVLSQWKL